MLNNLIKLNLKKKISISLVVFILIIGCLVYFIIIPTIGSIKAIGQNIENQRIDLEKKYIKGQNLRQLTKNLKKIEPQLVVLDQIFINQDYELEFIIAMEELANQNNVSQKINLDTSRVIEGNGRQILPLNLFLQGNYTDIINYLTSLETLNYYININSLELSSSGYTKLSAAPEIHTNFININMAISANIYLK
ncbi:MAG: hypothetical protein U9R14_03565 [Patescibacteria group bacterium]|nr:hypothetical protein [Patescibacteria group bacterium]